MTTKVDRPDINDKVCEMPDCSNIGTMVDDGIEKCQACLYYASQKKKDGFAKIKIINTGAYDPCPCKSEKKFKFCCGDKKNTHRQWLLQRIGRKVFYQRMPECDDPTCDDCKRAAEGIIVRNIEHVRMLDEWSDESGIRFIDIRPKYDTDTSAG